ncbi:hypothetical protein RMSM_05650 [Rhodopirellula maiorica SM1]|uniref:Uncharacterized protein n=1 Tax=Rhodopirellula maiorica SM1 TaxID=1265738 RepID=M5REA9_9BACT|nr:hypothetical protein [Rhodopirellula maiorica]EMI17421.1 hypothetical protein RMSM_05650 [Rhodopirellula maiorica SM1]
MSDTNPQIDEQLNKLAELCCEQLEGNDPSSTIDEASTKSLLKSLLMSGFSRKEGASLQVEIENRVKDRCRDTAMHRGGALSSISGQLQKQFEELARWESKQPSDDSKSKAANISSATDA